MAITLAANVAAILLTCCVSTVPLFFALDSQGSPGGGTWQLSKINNLLVLCL
ncbi:hypothetical protein [Candidatus Mycoplasma haematominutum]|uniref:hypothetical protein n=1 Tax=Candidatus Mycoplasma haematominutum TaxID=209446 RepID=UPI0016513E9B|nr:hypothetical protein [Candidatus Mycoplasma haematominutum]